MMKRRTFLQSIAAVTGATRLLQSCSAPPSIGGRMVGASASVGHLLRDKHFGEPVTTRLAAVVIVGGGISGLSAARQLHRQGVADVVLLDLEKQMGGNAASGANLVSAYPWGAHYVPVPNNNLRAYIRFLQECGVVTAIDAAGVPTYNELHLCFDPQERLYINGRWQEGLVPQYGVPDADKDQIRRFLEQMNGFRHATGQDGKEAFAIPVNDSSREEVYTRLDRISMKQWLQSNDYHSAYLHWYVNYCTRDDFGTSYDIASAWAGIHYFASRKGVGTNAAAQDVLTWPQGNGFLAAHLQKGIAHQLQTGSLVVKITPTAAGSDVDYYDVDRQELCRIRAKQCIVAVPQFVAARLLTDPHRIRLVQQHLAYSPWMVANFNVGPLRERSGAASSWDNVLYNSDSLGYVAATHELVQQHIPRKNLTYYLPLTGADPATARRQAQQRTHQEWVEIMVKDLSRVHPDIAQSIEWVDIMIWGHAMARPVPGLIHGPVREQLSASIGNRIHFAHTDLAGVSIFEEAFYQGLKAAEKVMAQLGT